MSKSLDELLLETEGNYLISLRNIQKEWVLLQLKQNSLFKWYFNFFIVLF